MFKYVSLALLALSALSAVHGLPLAARSTPPAGWIAGILEPYDTYHTRYVDIGCKQQHNTTFFDDCCHPLKKGETVENNRKPYCRPGYSSSLGPTVSPTPANTLVSNPSPSPAPDSTSDDGDDCEDDDDETDDEGDDCDDNGEPSPVPTNTQQPTDTPYSPQPTTTPYTPEPTTTPNAPEPTPSPDTPAPSPDTPAPSPNTPAPSPSPSPSPDNNPPSSDVHSGGFGTWFTQNGVAGACGTVHSDSDFIAALDTRTYGDTGVQSPYCGKQIRITWQGKTVDVTVADACPTCNNANSVDLSEGAFQALAPLSVGQLTDISWVEI